MLALSNRLGSIGSMQFLIPHAWPISNRSTRHFVEFKPALYGLLS